MKNNIVHGYSENMKIRYYFLAFLFWITLLLAIILTNDLLIGDDISGSKGEFLFDWEALLGLTIFWFLSYSILTMLNMYPYIKMNASGIEVRYFFMFRIWKNIDWKEIKEIKYFSKEGVYFTLVTTYRKDPVFRFLSFMFYDKSTPCFVIPYSIAGYDQMMEILQRNVSNQL